MTEASRAAYRDLLHPRLVGLGATLLIAVFVTDLLYWRTLLPEWSTFSIWLLTGGLVLAAWSGVAFVLDLVLGHVLAVSWGRFLALTAAALLSFLNAFIHSRDGYTSVVPQGLALSAIVAILLLVIGWRGWSVGTARPARLAAPPRAAASMAPPPLEGTGR
ncbi:MAG: hypothetical protein QOH81_2276 [Sphingomonadales bacterium]|jgi:uncharacterized membrane protein|nr:hypothetical protein [Sphingomonadales bacterium]